MDMLFPAGYDGTTDDLLDQAKHNFFKIYFLLFGLLEKVWSEKKASYMDFPLLIAPTSERLEKLLKSQVSNIFRLNIYLKDTFKLALFYFFILVEFTRFVDQSSI